jgi:hypothetical protein
VDISELIVDSTGRLKSRVRELEADLAVYKKYYTDTQAEKDGASQELKSRTLQWDAEKKDLEHQIMELKVPHVHVAILACHRC